jgi:hypothetical protein
VASIAWALRGLTRLPPHALLAGVVRAGRHAVAARGRGVAAVVAGGAVAVAAGLTLLTSLTDALSQSSGFFCGGAALLVACLSGLRLWLGGEPGRVIQAAGPGALLRLGVRNARRHTGRSTLTAGLIAAATFVIAALQAMRLEAPTETSARDSGTGGFALFAEAAVALPYDLNTRAGRAALNLSEDADTALAGAAFIPFRLRPGDETSCLNLYRPAQPRLLGAPQAMIERGGFAFSRTLAETRTEARNPWRLLRRRLADGAIPMIADEAAVLWQLHLALGDDLLIRDEHGREVHLRIVALSKGSFLQGELIVAEDEFVRLFPSVSGYAFHLIDVAPGRAQRVEETLERELSDFGLAATSTRQRLAELFVVQNTYLSTFQTLGGLGLLLGTVGLAAVLLRNVWERRGELALLRALGFSGAALGWMVVVENGLLVAAGLLAGLVSAGLAVAPHAVSRIESLPWQSLLLLLGAVFATGMLASTVALIPVLRARLLPALRSE